MEKKGFLKENKKLNAGTKSLKYSLEYCTYKLFNLDFNLVGKIKKLKVKNAAFLASHLDFFKTTIITQNIPKFLELNTLTFQMQGFDMNDFFSIYISYIEEKIQCQCNFS